MIVRNVLFLAEGQLGDLLLLTPAIRGLKSSFPAATLSVLVVERRLKGPTGTVTASICGPLGRDADSPLATNPAVDALYSLNRPALRSLRGFSRLRAELDIIRFLRSRRFDAVLCTFPEDRFTLWAFASGAAVRVGQKEQGLGWLLSHRPAIRKETKGVLQYYCDLVRSMGGDPETDRTEYAIPSNASKEAGEFLEQQGVANQRTLVAVHPGASGDYKIWPPDRFAELISIIRERWHATVLLCYGDQDKPVIHEIKRHLTTDVVEVNTGDGVSRLAALLARCSLCVSNDSGPRHLAVAVGIPTVALFRQHHDREWQVYQETDLCKTVKGDGPCPLCPSGVCLDKIPSGGRFGSHCIRTITVDRALAAIAPLLQ